VSVTSSRFVIKLVTSSDASASDARVREIWLRIDTVLKCCSVASNCKRKCKYKVSVGKIGFFWWVVFWDSLPLANVMYNDFNTEFYETYQDDRDNP